MCQPSGVFAVATITKEKAEILWKDKDSFGNFVGSIIVSNNIYKAFFPDQII